jgi:ABC-type multidrug transport system fused ATPase/permease subunit
VARQVLSVLAQATATSPDATVAPPAEVGVMLSKVTYHGVDEHTGELKPLLKDVSLNLPPGAKVAIVGVRYLHSQIIIIIIIIIINMLMLVQRMV